MVKRFFYLFLFITFLLSSKINAVIFESDNLKDIFKYVDKSSKRANKKLVIVFDIDSTIAVVENELEYWVKYKQKELEKIGLSADNASELALYMFFAFFGYSKLLPINDSTKVISDLQSMGIHVMALTNRSIPVVERTIKLLKNIGIDFSRRSLFKHDLELCVNYRGIFSNGIIFAGKNDKGRMLDLFFKKINYSPKKLIYVDDRLEYVKSVEKEFDRDKIEFIGLRDSFMDEKKKNFDPVAAENGIKKLKIQMGLELYF